VKTVFFRKKHGNSAQDNMQGKGKKVGRRAQGIKLGPYAMSLRPDAGSVSWFGIHP
jgi:hypothetical protein